MSPVVNGETANLIEIYADNGGAKYILSVVNETSETMFRRLPLPDIPVRQIFHRNHTSLRLVLDSFGKIAVWEF